MIQRSVASLALAGLLTAAPTVTAQQVEKQAQPESEARPQPQQAETDVDRLIEQLGAEDFQERRAAERQLRALGADARGALEDAIRHSDDPEVRWRAHRVLRALERDESGGGLRPMNPGAPGAPGQGFGPQTRWFGPWNGTGPDQDRVMEELRRAFQFQDPRFEDLQQRMEEMQRHIDEMMRGMPVPPTFGVPPGGAGVRSMGQGVSIQIGPDGVRVELDEQGANGNTEHKVYEAPSIEEFRQQYPDIAEQYLGDDSAGPGVFQFRFGPQRLPSPPNVTAPLTPRVAAPRGGLRLRAPIAGGVAPDVVDRPRLGIYVGPLTPGVREFLGIEAEQGLMVESVADGSLAASLGIQPKDVVLKVGGREIASPEDVAGALGAAEPGSTLEVVVNRMGEEMTLTTTLPKAAEKAQQKPATKTLKPVEVR